MKPKKIRLDQLIVDRGLAESKTRAQALVMAGHVFLGDVKASKPGQQVADDADISVKGNDHPWASRGGIKLAHALQEFGIDVSGLTAIDVGSSTGGFTDVLLAGGATKVY
ncbi:MAG TPA: SAM-dependent methyltransferase, partial [Sphingorhabdus sp.]|nr:SAM-dependent methyltransferase [Sphingorhabdus sp.]